MIRTALLAGFVALTVASSALAADWSVKNEKGVFVHFLTQKPYRLVLHCDPEGVWADVWDDGTRFHARNTFLMALNGEFLSGRMVLTNSGKSVKLTISGGAISKNEDEANFVAVTHMLLNGKPTKIEMGSHRLTISPKAVSPNTCDP